MRFLLILVVAAWGSSLVLAVANTWDKGLDAQLTAAYLLFWPVVAIVLFLNEPAPSWLVLPTAFGFVPWLVAGPHLAALLKDSAAARPNTLIGIRRAYWLWGSAAALLIGIVLE